MARPRDGPCPCASRPARTRFAATRRPAPRRAHGDRLTTAFRTEKRVNRRRSGNKPRATPAPDERESGNPQRSGDHRSASCSVPDHARAGQRARDLRRVAHTGRSSVGQPDRCAAGAHPAGRSRGAAHRSHGLGVGCASRRGRRRRRSRARRGPPRQWRSGEPCRIHRRRTERRRRRRLGPVRERALTAGFAESARLLPR